MSDSILNIIINTVKRGGGDKEAINNLVKLKTQFKEITGINLSSLTAYAAVGAAVGKIVDFTKKAIESNVKYVTTIQDIVRLTGLQAEEASRLFQVTDDLFIKEEKFTQAMQYAIKNGFEPTIDNIGKVADEYLAIQDPADKARFAMELFGKKAGPEMQKLLEQGSDAIRSKMDAVSKSLVVDQNAIRLTQKYKESVDNLGDSFNGIEYKVAKQVIPVLTDLNVIMAYIIDKTSNAEIKSRGFGEALQLILSGPLYPLIKYYELLIKAIDDIAFSISGVDPALRGINVGMGDLSTSTSDADEDIRKLSDSFQELTTKIIFNTLASHLDEEGQLELARMLGLLNETTYAAGIGLDNLTIKYDTNKNGTIDAKERTAEYYIELQKIIGTAGDYHWNFVVNSNVAGFRMAPGSYQEALQNGLINQGSGSSSSSSSGWVQKGTKGGPGTDKAWWNGSSWYYGDNPPGAATGGMVKVGEQGTEIVKLPDGAFVYNHEQTQQMLGGSNIGPITIQINGAGDPKRVADEVVRRLNIQSVGRFK
jgi:hypothetical protein